MACMILTLGMTAGSRTLPGALSLTLHDCRGITWERQTSGKKTFYFILIPGKELPRSSPVFREWEKRFEEIARLLSRPEPLLPKEWSDRILEFLENRAIAIQLVCDRDYLGESASGYYECGRSYWHNGFWQGIAIFCGIPAFASDGTLVEARATAQAACGCFESTLLHELIHYAAGMRGRSPHEKRALEKLIDDCVGRCLQELEECRRFPPPGNPFRSG